MAKWHVYAACVKLYSAMKSHAPLQQPLFIPYCGLWYTSLDVHGRAHHDNLLLLLWGPAPHLRPAHLNKRLIPSRRGFFSCSIALSLALPAWAAVQAAEGQWRLLPGQQRCW